MQFASAELDAEFVFLFDTGGFAGQFEKDSTRFEAWDGRFFGGSVRSEAGNGPKALFETKARMAGGAGDIGGLIVGEELGDAVHAGLAIGEIAVMGDRRIWGLGGQPVGNGTGIQFLEGAPEFLGGVAGE